MKSKFKILFICLLLVYSSVYANEQEINLNTIIDNAVKEKKQIAVFFHMTHCGYCKRMKNRTLQDPQIQAIMKKSFVLVDVNIDHKESVQFNNIRHSKKEFAHSIDVDFFPTVLFFDENYDVIYTVRGYRDSKKFKQILQFIETKSYDSMDFFDFEQKKKEE